MNKSSIFKLSLLALCVFALFLCTVADEASKEESTSETRAPVAEEEEVAKLLVYKTVPEFEAVMNQNLTFIFTIYNIGKSSAYDVTLEDNDWSDSKFVSVTDGTSKTTFEKIAPGQNVTFNYTITPKDIGEISTTSATVTFKTSPKDENVKTVRSTDLPPIPVLTTQEYEKKHDKHYDEWAIFFLLTLLPVGVPAMIYFYSSNQVYSLAHVKQKSD